MLLFSSLFSTSNPNIPLLFNLFIFKFEVFNESHKESLMGHVENKHP